VVDASDLDVDGYPNPTRPAAHWHVRHELIILAFCGGERGIDELGQADPGYPFHVSKREMD